MSLFRVKNEARTRRLLMVLGVGLIGLGLLLGIFDKDVNERTLEQSREWTARIHASLEPVFEISNPAEQRHQLDELLAGLNLAEAPPPLPERVSTQQYELFFNTSSDFLVFFFAAIGYTDRQLEDQETPAIPPLIVLSIPENWVDDKSVALKKSLFFRVILPLVLLENKKVLEERALVEGYLQLQRNRSPVTPEMRARLMELAVHYGVVEEDKLMPLELAEIELLLRRVDIVPPSLALAQAAYESGYGASRFTSSGNALFGQWDWSRDALRPENQREGLGDYGIKVFDQPLDSVKAYLRNLNTHRTYEEFRSLRSQQRDGRSGRVTLDSNALAATLLGYSEQGAEYTTALQEMIGFNQLTLLDNIELSAGEPVYFD